MNDFYAARSFAEIVDKSLYEARMDKMRFGSWIMIEGTVVKYISTIHHSLCLTDEFILI